MEKLIKEFLISALFGLLMMSISWIASYLTINVLILLAPPGAYELEDLELASIVRSALFLIHQIFSVQVWLFSTLYFFDRSRKK